MSFEIAPRGRWFLRIRVLRFKVEG